MGQRRRRALGRGILFLLLIALLFYAIIAHRKKPVQAFAPSQGNLLILDAGHGGADGGAVSASGLQESTLNLDIVFRMRELCRLLAVPCVLTRDSEQLAYPSEADTIAKMKRWDVQQRVSFVNSHPQALLLSIHQNFYPSQQPQGPQLFFSDSPYPEKLASEMQASMTINLYPNNRRLAAPMPDDIYLAEHSRCPMILCECGFLSNPEEAAKLGTEEYRSKIAVILFAAYCSTAKDTI